MFDRVVDWGARDEFGELPDAYLSLVTDVAAAELVVDDGVDSIPAGLDEMQPGPALAAFLAGVDVSRCSGFDRVVVLRAQARMASHYSGSMYRSMGAITEWLRDDEEYWGDDQAACEGAAAEVPVALRLTRRAAVAEHSLALELLERVPMVLEALEAGAIDERRAKTIVRHTFHLSTGAAREVVDQIIDVAAGLTTGQLTARLKKLCIAANPDEALERYRAAVTERRVVSVPNVDGTASITAVGLAPHRVAAAMGYVNRLARSLRGSGEARSMDQLRADILTDLLSGRHPNLGIGHGNSGGAVDLRVGLATLAGLNDDPAELGGYGPIVADVARQVADESRDAQWRYTIVDADTGQPIGGGITRRRHTAAQERRIESRDLCCVFPGCRMPAASSDIDHRIPHAEGGNTSTADGAALCRHDHTTRHRHHWSYEPLPNGDYEWTTHLGHRYTTSGRSP